MENTNKALGMKTGSFIVNLIEGAVTVLALAVTCSFVFETNHQDIGFGLFVIMIWLLILLMPNIIFRMIGNFNDKETAVFQIVPLLLGAMAYCAFQLILW